MPTKSSLFSQLRKSKNLSPESVEMLKWAVERCPDDDLDLLQGIIIKCDEKVSLLKQEGQQKRVLKTLELIDELIL